MNSAKLTTLIKKAPKKPGVYQFKNNNGKSIYIGKAHNLNQRLRSYPKTKDVRIRSMIEEANSLSWAEAQSDIESLILESQLIKTKRPKYNIVMRDDKRYSYVAFTKDEYPKIFVSHQIDSGNNEYIGPFTEGTSIRLVLRYLRKIFPYCTCSQRHNRKCLNAHIGKCLGYCCLNNLENSKDNKKQYQNNIKIIKGILSGRKKIVLEQIEKDMIGLAKKEDFNGAISLRDTIERINKVFNNSQFIKKTQDSSYATRELSLLLDIPNINRIEGYDISNIQGEMAVGSMVVFEKGLPNPNEYRVFNIKDYSNSNDTGMLKEILTRRFNHPEWPYPDLILIDGGRGQLNISSMAIPNNIKVISLTKNERHKASHILIKGNKNPIKINNLSDSVKNLLINIDNEAHRFAISKYRKKHRAKLK